MNDNELFTLSKQVYKKTGWGTTRPHTSTHIFYDQDGQTFSYPIYDSDYLLERLPKAVERSRIKWYLELSPQHNTKPWIADYVHNEYENNYYEDNYYLFDSNQADTPIKALLLLTLALAEAGELK
jgi:hypothetical protein